MIEDYFIELCGKPQSKLRPRFSKRGTYDPQYKEKKATQLLLRNAWPSSPLTNEINLDLSFFLPCPKSWSKKKKKSVNSIFHLVKPDIDNLLKFYLDCMNGIVYADDKQIVSLSSKKMYCLDDPRTVIVIKQAVPFNYHC